MKLVLDITIFVLIIFNLVIHSIGCYALVNVYKYRRRNVEQLFIISLSFVELAIHILQFAIYLPYFVTFSDGVSSSVDEFQYYLKIVLFTGVFPAYYLSMNYITTNKLLDVLLNIRYSLYWDKRKTKRLIKVTSCICSILALCFSLSYKILGYKFEEVFYTYIYPMFNFSFLIIATISHSYIFYKFKESRSPPNLSKSRRKPSTDCKRRMHSGASSFTRCSVVKVFQNSRFYVSVMLILSFLVFMVIPNVIYLVYGLMLKEGSQRLGAIVQVCYEICFLADGYIYIFIEPRVRSMLRRKLCFSKSRHLLIPNNIPLGVKRRRVVALGVKRTRPGDVLYNGHFV